MQCESKKAEISGKISIIHQISIVFHILIYDKTIFYSNFDSLWIFIIKLQRNQVDDDQFRNFC